MSLDRPVHPMDQPDYLDGYLSAVHDDDDMPDGAWFAAQVALIAEHWNIDEDNAHEAFMQYLEWKEHDNNRKRDNADPKNPTDASDQGDPEVERG